MNCKKAKILSIPYILGDLDVDSEQYCELEVHLANCQACAEEYKANKHVVEFIKEHTTEFAEVFESIDKEKTVQQCIRLKLNKAEPIFHRTIRAGLAAAACIAIGISIWLVYSNPAKYEGPTAQKVGVNPELPIKIELATDNHKILPAGTKIRTTNNELKTLIVNTKHHIVLNQNTSLSAEPLLKKKLVGCAVRLNFGEIFVHVESDGCPFVVSTAHGRAIITGTTFDVKTTNDSTTLVVAEGTVQFESEKGFEVITSGQTSKIVGRSGPTKPTECNSSELTTWAIGEKVRTTLTKTNLTTDSRDAGSLKLTMSYSSINLDGINYEDWIQKKQGWFKQYFPWIFVFRDALFKNGIKVGYPELLIQSGDVWNLIHPENLSCRIHTVNEDSLLRAASRYGFDRQWLLTHLPEYAAKDFSETDYKSEVLQTFDKWLDSLEEAKKSSKESDTDTILYSLNASIYLANTRTLIWLCVKNGHLGCEAQERANLLSLLQEEVRASLESFRIAAELMMAANNLCSPEYTLKIEQITEKAEAIYKYEKEIVTNGYCE